MIHFSVVVVGWDARTAGTQQLAELDRALRDLGEPYEILCLAAGRCSVRPVLPGGVLHRQGLRLLEIEGSVGAAGLITAGLAAAQGEVLLVVEAGQAYPADQLVQLWKHLQRADLVQGRRRHARLRKWTARLLQIPRALLLGVHARDPDCLCWVARREAVEGLQLTAGLHRFIAPLVAARGYRVHETYIRHRDDAVRPRLRPVRGNPGDLLFAWWFRRRWRAFHVHETDASSAPAKLPAHARLDEPHTRSLTSDPADHERAW